MKQDLARKYFGTDGVRGRANQPPMTPDIALKLGMAVGQYFRAHEGEHRVVIGKDTRRSCYMLENALAAGFTSVGMTVFFLGPVPTPAVGILTRNMRADIGVMISASHNAAHDNGIKFFGPDGYKLSDAAEMEIERLMASPEPLSEAAAIGHAQRIDDAAGRYIEYAKTIFPRQLSLEGLKIVIDAANGAAYKCAPSVLFELGAEPISIGTSPNGENINKGCGSTDPDAARISVLSNQADIGICLDGDGDRLLLIDEKGDYVDGDQYMATIARDWIEGGKLARNTLVSTIMSNLGLERFMEAQGGKLLRTRVGDRYVVEAMREGGYNFGGEQSGHMVMSDYATTGDGIIAALQFLSVMVERQKKSSELAHIFEPVPQELFNITYDAKTAPLERASVKQAIADAKVALGDEGRIVVRKSGTEPLIRVMAEAWDEEKMKSAAARVCEAIKAG